jgi:hypothetical protein
MNKLLFVVFIIFAIAAPLAAQKPAPKVADPTNASPANQVSDWRCEDKSLP